MNPSESFSSYYNPERGSSYLAKDLSTTICRLLDPVSDRAIKATYEGSDQSKLQTLHSYCYSFCAIVGTSERIRTYRIEMTVYSSYKHTSASEYGCSIILLDVFTFIGSWGRFVEVSVNDKLHDCAANKDFCC